MATRLSFWCCIIAFVLLSTSVNIEGHKSKPAKKRQHSDSESSLLGALGPLLSDDNVGVSDLDVEKGFSGNMQSAIEDTELEKKLKDIKSIPDSEAGPSGIKQRLRSSKPKLANIPGISDISDDDSGKVLKPIKKKIKMGESRTKYAPETEPISEDELTSKPLLERRGKGSKLAISLRNVQGDSASSDGDSPSIDSVASGYDPDASDSADSEAVPSGIKQRLRSRKPNLANIPDISDISDDESEKGRPKRNRPGLRNKNTLPEISDISDVESLGNLSDNEKDGKRKKKVQGSSSSDKENKERSELSGRKLKKHPTSGPLTSEDEEYQRIKKLSGRPLAEHPTSDEDGFMNDLAEVMNNDKSSESGQQNDNAVPQDVPIAISSDEGSKSDQGRKKKAELSEFLIFKDKNQKELPNLYPYQNDGKDKVKLLNEEDIWIDRKHLESLKTQYKYKPGHLTNALLTSLLGKKNIKNFSVGGHLKPIPENLLNAICKFVHDFAPSGYKKEKESCISTILSFLERSQRKFDRGEISESDKGTDTEAEQQGQTEDSNLSPYEIKGEKKVKLSNEEEIWIDRKHLESLKSQYKYKPGHLTNALLTSLLGENNVKKFSVDIKPNFKTIPKHLIKAICKFVHDFVPSGYKKDDATCIKTIKRFLTRN